jgi:hypothetical protein
MVNTNQYPRYTHRIYEFSLSITLCAAISSSFALITGRPSLSRADCEIEFTELCHRCSRMEAILSPGGYNPIRGHNGNTARAIDGGSIRVGEKVKLVKPIRLKCTNMNLTRVTTATLLLPVAPLRAEETAAADRAPLWELRLVAFGKTFPAYPSSTDQNITLLPIPVPIYRGKFLRFSEGLEDLASGRVLDRDHLKLSIGLSSSFPEDSDALSIRTGCEGAWSYF